MQPCSRMCVCMCVRERERERERERACKKKEDCPRIFCSTRADVDAHCSSHHEHVYRSRHSHTDWISPVTWTHPILVENNSVSSSPFQRERERERVLEPVALQLRELIDVKY
ncbi:hypothetical protein KP509_29G009900 [Ceratopteris richardii]|uniref:Uncharacterized protein n=1 Tax=Ceratopteris richardii TaxID=49495 RepID=A0A8T2R4P1_CERRI|nr:hypothetical protein KP509_29G009900 [Ceratopteris richardii]